MSNQPDHQTSLISIVGTHPRDLQLLANLAPPVDDPESIFSVVGSLQHETPVTWTKMYEAEAWVTSMIRSPTGRLYAVDMEGQLHSTDTAGKWTTRDLGCPDGLIDLWVASDDELFAAGDQGDRVHFSKGKVELVRDPTNRRLNAVHGCAPNDVYMVGDKGAIFQYRDGQWAEMEPPTNYNLLTVLCISQQEIYVAGARGMLFRGSGNDWEQLKAPDINISSLAWYRGALHAAGGKDGVFRLEPHGLEQVKNLTLYRLRTIGDHLFGLGGRLVARFDGTGWWGGPLNL
ncbi:MAG TPA: hypothetical protein VFZ09_25015 [Archangium sp.]|uniref:WD40/YVTN/BNR-like repeat-containing protein n=1 Tax=Archangium sp. TaxID=1872627 RepID=UPI002E3268C2|nr:hypothetical protein [Archangium sp.]HEX5749514.1 hypothetical protein [Archangium sp.]